MNEENSDLLREKYSDTFKEYQRGRLIRKIYKISLIFLIIVYFSLVISYFSVPSFKLKGISYSGLKFFTKEDIISLLEEDSNRSLLFFKDEGKRELILKNSNHTILDKNLHVESDSFNGFISVTEDVPVAFIDDRLYFSSGRDYQLYSENLSSCKISDESKKRILNSFSSFITGEKKLPVLHLSKDVNPNDKENIKKALMYLKGIDIDVLSSYISDIDYPNSSQDPCFYSLMNIYIPKSKNSSKYDVIIKNVRADCLSLLLSSSFSSLLSNINFYIDNNSEKIVYQKYRFADSSLSADAFTMVFHYNENTSTMKVDALLKEVNNE